MKMSRCVLGAAALCVASFVPAKPLPKDADVIGTWHLVRIDAPGPDGKPVEGPQPTGMLIYTQDRHASIQLMYSNMQLSNEFVHDGYEATFGSYELDTVKHQLIYHVEASATRDKLVGQSETLSYELPDARHMILRPTDAAQHWSVTWSGTKKAFAGLRKTAVCSQHEVPILGRGAAWTR